MGGLSLGAHERRRAAGLTLTGFAREIERLNQVPLDDAQRQVLEELVMHVEAMMPPQALTDTISSRCDAHVMTTCARASGPGACRFEPRALGPCRQGTEGVDEGQDVAGSGPSVVVDRERLQRRRRCQA